MNKFICLFWVTALACVARADSNVVFQIGAPDGDYHEFAIAGNFGQYAQQFPNDVNYTIGQSDPARDWPYILPGPVDSWAGSRTHPFTIHFQISRPESGYYQLDVDFVNTHDGAPPDLVIDVNGGSVHQQLPRGAGGDASLTNPKAGKPYSVHQLIPATVFHSGDNTITLSSDGGSWALFDDIRLESGVSAPAETLTMQAEPLPFFKQSANGLGRAVRLTINSLEWDRMPAELDWSSKGGSGLQQINVAFGNNEPMLIVPDTDEVDVILKMAGRQINLPVALPPAKKWLLYIVPTSHTDIGYTDFQSRIRVRHANNGVAALQLLNEYPNFKWYSETFWQLNVCLQLHPELTDEIFERLRENRWGLSADYANMLTGLCSSEALDRLTLDSRKVANRGGFVLDSDILDDVPSAVGSLPMVLAHSGIKYFIEGANNDRAPYAGQVPNPFYWEGPDGSRVLAEITTRPGYGGAGNLLMSVSRAMVQLPQWLERFETSDYPYDAALINGSYSDNHPVLDWLPKVVNEWNSQWAYPKMILAEPNDFYGYILKNFSNKIPVLKTDFGDWWADGAGSAAYETALSRRAEERAVTGEILHSLASILTGAAYPRTNFDGLWENILLYNEHTWGAAGSIGEPYSAETVGQWKVKAAYAVDADTQSRTLLDSGMSELADVVPASDLIVFNPLTWQRNAVVKTEMPVAVQDMETERVYPCQSLPEGGSCFVADNLPPIGYRTYKQATLTDTPADAVQISGNTMENEFYRVSLNPATGGISSIYDKQLGRELVDSDSEYNLGELIYVEGGEGTYAIHSDLKNLPPPQFSYHPQSGVKIESINGPVFGELDSHATAEDFPGITMRVRLYRGIKQLDLIFELDKKETLSKEGVYLAFPFALRAQNGGLWLDYPDEITEPLKDQHASACRDWYSVQRWMAISDGDDTVELSSLDAPLFTIGGMTACTWPRELSLPRGHVFGYIMNNYWHTNYKAQQGGHFVLRYSITSDSGGFSKSDAVMRGWNMYCPAVAARGAGDHKPVFSSPAASFAQVEPAGLPLTTIKGAEDGNGFIFRYCDYAGEGGTLRLTLPRAASEATQCNLVETDEGKARKYGRRVSVPLTPYAPASVRVTFPN
ncbi:MAG TPA: polysaccharide lyase family protein [Alphaproteobacteria bacterium]|nr:polysaccharide lyase family protein [Alphaproteobacteria bacterium]